MKFKKIAVSIMCLIVLIVSVPEAINATGTLEDAINIDDIVITEEPVITKETEITENPSEIEGSVENIPTPLSEENVNEEETVEVETQTLKSELNEGDVLIDEEHFPDDAFRAYILDKHDGNKDQILNKNERETEFPTFVQLSVSGVKSLKGIEYLTKLTTINLNMESDLTTLGADLSQNKKLTTISIQMSSLEEIDVTNVPSLLILRLEGNNLSQIDVSKNPLLIQLDMRGNPISSLDLSNNAKLENVSVENTKVKTLDLSHCSELKTIALRNNQFISLHLPKPLGSFSGNGVNPQKEVQLNMSSDSTIDLKEIDPNFDVGQVADLDGATMSDKGVLSGFSFDKNITYTYYPIPNNTTLKFQANIKVMPAANKWVEEVAISNWNVNETASTPKGSALHGTVKFTYSNSENGTYVDTKPTNVGTYYLKATVEKGVLYEGLDSTPIAFSILNPKGGEPILPDNLVGTSGQPLSSVVFSESEWTWENNQIIIENEVTEYKARYAVNDHNIYDYTHITGYNKDEHYIEYDITIKVNKIFTVEFNFMGGSFNGNSTPSFEATVAENQLITSYPKDELLTKEGHVFKGWHKEPECTNKWEFLIEKVDSNTTLYAKWEVSPTPTPVPTPVPTAGPTVVPVPTPTLTARPIIRPSVSPTIEPSATPSVEPTISPEPSKPGAKTDHIENTEDGVKVETVNKDKVFEADSEVIVVNSTSAKKEEVSKDLDEVVGVIDIYIKENGVIVDKEISGKIKVYLDAKDYQNYSDLKVWQKNKSESYQELEYEIEEGMIVFECDALDTYVITGIKANEGLSVCFWWIVIAIIIAIGGLTYYSYKKRNKKKK